MTNPTPQPDPKALASELQRYRDAAIRSVDDSRSARSHVAEKFGGEVVIRLLGLLTSTQEENERLTDESAALTKALTGLTCGGSEFFVRKGERFVADIAACVEWVRRSKADAHRRTVEAIGKTRSAEALTLSLRADNERLKADLEDLTDAAFKEGFREGYVYGRRPEGSDDPEEFSRELDMEPEEGWSISHARSRMFAALSSSPDLVGGDQGSALAESAARIASDHADQERT